MNINTAFPSDYLKAADIPPGRRVTVLIQSVTIEKVGRSDTRPVVYFQGKQKGLVLNKTNARMIAKIARSDQTEHWGGIAIALYTTQVEYQGNLVDALRVDYPPEQQAVAGPRPHVFDSRNGVEQPAPTSPAQSPTAAPPFDGDEIPF